MLHSRALPRTRQVWRDDAWSQLAALVRMRWLMVRTGKARRGFAALGLAFPGLCVAAVVGAPLVPRDRASDVILLVPTAYLAVAFLSVLAPLVAGGGTELFPADQLVAFPVSLRTQHLASLTQVPLNLAWVVQVVGVVGLTSYAADWSPYLPLALLVVVSYVAFVTVAGHALGWLVVGARLRAGGRQLTWLLAGVVLASVALVIATGRVGAVLDRSPTARLVSVVVSRGPIAVRRSVTAVVVLVALTVLAFLAGRAATAWALRRPGDAGGPLDASVHQRRAPRGGAAREGLAVDRASIWRSPSLRRGLLVLAALPGMVAAAAGLDWSALVLLPGLVSAGAGLLFGVNAFCLDGSGAVWLASLPGRPAVAFWVRARVVAETCLVAAAITVTAGSLRAGRWPTTAEASALLGCAVVASLRVVALCMELSIHRPHRADLRGPRDTPAPPGVMTAYSLRLAASTTLVGVVFSLCARSDQWGWSVLWALPLVLLATRRLVRAGAAWDDNHVRARVVATVAGG